MKFLSILLVLCTVAACSSGLLAQGGLINAKDQIRKGDLSDAENYLTMTRRYAQKSNDTEMLSEVSVLYGDIYEKRENYTQAMLSYLHSVKTYPDTQSAYVAKAKSIDLANKHPKLFAKHLRK